MYPSRGGSGYGQQQYTPQQGYGQGAASSFRSHPSLESQYGGQYSSVYGTPNANISQQASGMGSKVAVTSSVHGRSGYGSGLGDPPAVMPSSLGSGLGVQTDEYLPSSKYGRNSDHYASMKSDYASGERHHYGDHLAPYMGRDLKTDEGRRYSDSVGLSHQHVEQMDQASLLRQQQLLKAPSLQVTSDLRMPLATSSLDGSSRQTEYLPARAAPIRNSQDISSYGRIDSGPRNFPVLGNSYVDSQPPSLLGSAPRRNMDDILHGQGPVGGVYGVGLPPGRDYAASKGLHGYSIDSDYAGCVLSATVRSKSDDRNDERSIFRHELEMRELDRRREHMHLHERDKERDRERERERRERERERERDRERERVRERGRERERVRERDHLRRELERERECKRSIVLRRERTPATNTRDHRSSSLVKDERPAQKEPLPINDVSHRRYFPVRGKRKEYVCKVLPHSLIDFERDYMSISERYPKLSISPEFSKVVAYWPKSDLVLSIHTPACFEHELIEECNNTERNLSVKTLVGKPQSSNPITTVWNAKVLLMSGISAEAFAELCADNNVDDRIPHFNNILRFAILRKDRTLMSIGGRWEDAIDGGNPCVEDAALIRAALRYTKDLTQVDLSKCQCWNRFLEIHYDRVGKDGLFSHKEITVLFVPNLSACLPSMDAWRSDWYAVKKTKAESEQRQIFQKEKRVNNAEDQKGGTSQIKCGKNAEAAKRSREERKNVCEGKKISPMVVGDTSNDVKSMTNKLQDDSKDGEDEKKVCQVEAKTNGEEFVAGTPKIVKRKIVKKVKKIKVGCGRKGKTEINTIVKDETGEGSVKEGAKEVESQGASGMVGSEDCKLEGDSEKPPRSRKIIRKIAKGKVVHKESVDAEDKKSDEAQNESRVPEIAAASGEPNSGVKRTMKRKIIRKVVARKKTPEGEDDSKVVEKNQVNDGNGTMDDNTKVPKPLQEQDALVECAASRQDIKIDDASSSASKKKGDFGKRTASATTVDMKEKMKSESKDVQMKVSKLFQEQDTVVACGTKDVKVGEEGKGASKMKGDSGKKTTSATITVDMKEKVKPETKNDMPEQRSNRSSKEGQKFEEPPVHPGLFLQTKWTKESKLRSLSLSLDALLDYNDKDFEESTFELSLFAESMYEMLQYQMGSRILEFLQERRLKFITRRSLKRKEKGEIADKDGDGEKQPKRLKHNDDSPVVMEPSVKLEASDGTKEKDNTSTVSEEKLLPVDNSKTDDIEEEPEEDPEEEPEEDPEDVSEDPEDIGDGNIEDASEEEKNDCEAAILQDGVDKVRDAIWDKLISWGEGTDNKDEKDKDVNADEKTHVCEGDDPIQKKADIVKEPAVVNELLQAFRFFDRNRVGYLKVEDLRLIIHNLGKFLSHGDVKELVESALLESSAGRNNRILYHKLLGQS